MIRRLVKKSRGADPPGGAAPPLAPEVRAEVVAFLREWLPAPARSKYREMIAKDPEGWHRHAHFGEGVAIVHFLRGNGLDERALGVRSLEGLWPELLREAVAEGKARPEEVGGRGERTGPPG